jgi:hypothetical protein
MSERERAEIARSAQEAREYVFTGVDAVIRQVRLAQLGRDSF